MASGVIQGNPIIDYGKVIEGNIEPSTSEAPSTSFAVDFGKTFPEPPFVMAHVYPQTRYSDRTIYITTITNITTTGCVINVVNPYTSATSLSNARCLEWMAVYHR